MFYTVALVLLFQSGPGPAITQHRINEYAAACAEAVDALRGAKASHPPSESPHAYFLRIGGYAKALREAAASLRPLGEVPAIHDRSAENQKRWTRIATDVKALPTLVKAMDAARNPKAPPGASTQLDKLIHQGLYTVQEIFNALRDARP